MLTTEKPAHDPVRHVPNVPEAQPETDDIPASWVWTTVEEVAHLNPGLGQFTPSDETDVTFVPMRAVEELSGRFDASNSRKYGEVKKGYTAFIDGDLIFAKVTPCMENGKLAVVNGLRNGLGCGSTEFHVLRATMPETAKYLFHFLSQSSYRRIAEGSMTGAVGLRRVPTAFLAQSVIPLPPLPEQRRIVSKLEELLTKLEAGVKALERTRALLRRYRQSVLKAAVEGELTREWREQHRHELEPAQKLLERVLSERRAKWEAEQLEKMRLKGLNPLTDAWKAKYEEPQGPDVSSLPELPEGWVWASIAQVASLQAGYAFPSSGFKKSGVKLLKGVNVRDGWLADIDVDYWDEVDAVKLQKFLLRTGDIAIAMDRPVYSSGSRATKVVQLTEDWNGALLLQRVGRFLTTLAIEAGYLYVFVRGPTFRQHLIRSQKGSQDGKDLPHVSSETIDSTPIPIPPLKEQAVIATFIERRLEVLDTLEDTLENELKRAEHLRQSILKRAFAGKLVPQDPNDEPAAELLHRIKLEKAQRFAGTQKHRRTRETKNTVQDGAPGDAPRKRGRPRKN